MKENVRIMPRATDLSPIDREWVKPYIAGFVDKGAMELAPTAQSASNIVLVKEGQLG